MGVGGLNVTQLIANAVLSSTYYVNSQRSMNRPSSLCVLWGANLIKDIIMKKYNLLRTLAFTGLCCASITGAIAMGPDVYPPTSDEVFRSLHLKEQGTRGGYPYATYEGVLTTPDGNGWKTKGTFVNLYNIQPWPTKTFPIGVDVPTCNKMQAGSLSLRVQYSLGANPEIFATSEEHFSSGHERRDDECVPTEGPNGSYWRNCPLHHGG